MIVNMQQLDRLLKAFEEAEWANKIWTDYPACPFCSNLQEDGQGHEPDCRWLAIMKEWGRR